MRVFCDWIGGFPVNSINSKLFPDELFLEVYGIMQIRFNFYSLF